MMRQAPWDDAAGESGESADGPPARLTWHD
jgi:hypothetical protein